jgi:hypothetical protein
VHDSSPYPGGIARRLAKEFAAAMKAAAEADTLEMVRAFRGS